MKKIGIAIIAVLCTCCSNPSSDSTPTTLYITSSVGAFNGEKSGDILSGNGDAYVTISPVSTDIIALNVVYAWGEYGGISIEVPEVEITGSGKDFTISRDNVAAKCRLSFSGARKEIQDIDMDIVGHYKSGGLFSEEVSFDLVLSPSDNTICPWLEIKEVSPTPVELPMGGSIAEYPASKLIIKNRLSVPVSIKWEGDPIDPITINVNETKICWGREDWYDELNFPQATLIAEGQEYDIDLFADGGYTKVDRRVYHIVDGRPETHRYYEYTIDLTPIILIPPTGNQ